MRKWYTTAGDEGDVIISSRVRLARNVQGIPFPGKMSAEQARKLKQDVITAAEAGAFGEHLGLTYIDLSDKSASDRMSYVERHLISGELAKKGGGLLLSEDETVSIMICEEDHLRLQVLSAGLAIEKCYDLADKLDDLLDEKLTFAFDADKGYLTHCPTNLGTGMRVSVMAHLPALEHSGTLRQLVNAAGKLGITIRGTYGEGTAAEGSFYQISNGYSLGQSEQQVIENIAAVVGQIVAEERRQRESFTADTDQFADSVFRALGTLRAARLLSRSELLQLTGKVRLGICAGIVKDVDLNVIGELVARTGANTIAASDSAARSTRLRDKARAQIARTLLHAPGEKTS